MKAYEIKTSEHLAVLTLHDRSFSNFCKAIASIPKKPFKGKKIMMMQTVEKENQPLRVVIVFEF